MNPNPAQYHSKYHDVNNNKTMAAYLGVMKLRDKPKEMARFIEKNRKLFPHITDSQLRELSLIE